MEKKRIIFFLKNKRRNIYAVIVETYIDQIAGTALNLAFEIIKEDLEAEAGEKVRLNYFSLSQAISKFRKSHLNRAKVDTQAPQLLTKKKYDFKDSHESDSNSLPLGSFKIE